MSFLDLVRDGRGSLRHTRTVVTQLDGRRYVDTSASDVTETVLPPKHYGFVVDTKPDDKPARVYRNLLVGAQDCTEIQVLTSNSITHVLSVGITPATRSPTVNYHFVECLDLPETDFGAVLRSALDFLHVTVCARAEHRDDQCTCTSSNVLVHCNAGVSRSVAVVIGYLMSQERLSFVEALERVKRVRACAKPNDGFVAQLKQLQN